MLILKQEKFCQYIIKGMSQTDAYREALEISPRGQDIYRVITEDGEFKIIASPMGEQKIISTMYSPKK